MTLLAGGLNYSVRPFYAPYTNHTVPLQMVMEKGSGFKSPMSLVALACLTAPIGDMYLHLGSINTLCIWGT